MATAPTINEAITRLSENENRIDIFTNQDGFYLTNETVPRQVESLPSLVARIQDRYLNIVDKGDWTTSANYVINDVVKESGIMYLCVTTHIAGVFATDLAANKWVVYQGDLRAADLASSAAGKGAELVAFKQSGIGAVERTAMVKMREALSVTDYASIQESVTAAAGGSLVAPAGDYTIDADLTGLEQVRNFVNLGARFQNYSIKEFFPDEIFKKAEEKLKTLFSQRLSTAGNYPTVVITGDSLSYNHQDFDATSRLEADDCYPGMNSWAFLIRDALIRNDPFFKHADEVPYLLGTGPSALYGNGASRFVMPFNGRVNILRATAQAQEIKLYYKHHGPQNKIYLWFLKNPNDTGCSFKVLVNGNEQVAVWNTGGTTAADPYQGLELHFLEIPNVPNTGLWTTISLTNFVGTAAAPHATYRDVYFCGISSSFTNVKLTGKGSQSSKWLVDNLATRLTGYAPDLAIVIIGANDPWSGNPQGLQTVQQYQTNLQAIIDGLRAAKSTAQMLLISPPLTSETIVPNATMRRYIAKAREVAAANGIAFLDLEDFFASTPTSVYRYDSIHFSKQGNEMLARKIASMILPASDIKPGYLKPNFSCGPYQHAFPVPPSERAYVVWNGSAFTITRLSGDAMLTPILSVTKVNDYTIEVAFAVSTALYSRVSVEQFDANGLQRITASPQNYFDERIRFQLRKQDGSQLVLADWASYSSSLKFIIECA